MSDRRYLDQAEALILLREALPGFGVAVERAPNEHDDADVSFTGPDGRVSPWSILLGGTGAESLFSFGDGALRSEVSPSADELLWCARVILATSAEHYTYKTGRWADRLEVTLDDGTPARWSTWPGSGRRKT